MKRLLREPFLHFLALGLFLFLLFQLVSKPEDSERDIVVDDSTLEHLMSIWELQWKRPPTQVELEGLVRKYIRQEVYYREALRMKLDHNDEIVKRRLAQKMEFLSDDLSAVVAPSTEENLRKYYEAHRDKYRTSVTYTIHQIAFTESRHTDPKAKALQVLQAARAEDLESLLDQGDPFLLSPSFSAISADRLQRGFGRDFAEALPDLPTGQWAGPVPSGFGYHLVYITDRQEARIADFEEVQQAVQRDFEYDKSRESRESIYSELRKHYRITIETEALDEGIRKQLANWKD